jgi:hypothetical protein
MIALNLDYKKKAALTFEVTEPAIALKNGAGIVGA